MKLLIYVILDIM